MHVKLEGNTDERGTREYNIGLGERRAQAVRRALMLQGVAESQLTTVSFGSERPAAEGDDEGCVGASIGRVELVYTRDCARFIRFERGLPRPRWASRAAPRRRRTRIRCKSN